MSSSSVDASGLVVKSIGLATFGLHFEFHFQAALSKLPIRSTQPPTLGGMGD